MIIYRCACVITGKSYIGKTRKSLQQRSAQHLQQCNKNRTKFYNALQKYGSDQFIWTILENVSVDNCDEREQYWIKQYNSYVKGYNSTKGGDGQDPTIASQTMIRYWETIPKHQRSKRMKATGRNLHVKMANDTSFKNMVVAKRNKTLNNNPDIDKINKQKTKHLIDYWSVPENKARKRKQIGNSNKALKGHDVVAFSGDVVYHEFASIRDAKQSLGATYYGITKAIKTRTKHAGYFWMYKMCSI